MRRLFAPALRIALAVAASSAHAALFDAWLHHADLTFSGYAGAETLAAFPVLVSITNFPGFAYGQMGDAAGGDLRFTDASGDVELNYELDTWNASGASLVWVQVPALAGTTTKIRAHWGHPTASAPAYASNGSTWSNGYAAVYHLDEPSGTLADDSQQENTLTANGSMQQGVAGYVGDTARWPGTSTDWLRALDDPSLDGMTGLTIETWIHDEYNDTMPRAIVSKRIDQTTGRAFALFKYTDRRLFLDIGSNRSDLGTPSATGGNQWIHVATTFDGAALQAERIKAYLDGGLKSTVSNASTSVPATTGNMTVGTLNSGYSSTWKGRFDELRISRVARSADWIQATWLTMASNTVFATYGETTGAIGSRVWDDSSGMANNGIQDAGETGLVGVAVALYALVDQGGGVVATNQVAATATDGDGLYLFSDLAPGDYALGITPPASYALSRRNAGGDPAADSDFVQATGYTAPIAVVAGGTSLDVDAGFYYAPLLAAVTSFRAFERDGAAVVAWEVAEEFDTLRYWLERRAGDAWVRVNPDAPVAAQSAENPYGPYRYELGDPGAAAGATYAWRLVEEEAGGALNVYGPYTVAVGGAAADFDAWAAGVAWDGAAAGRDDDPDGDGLANVEEYLAGTDPLGAESVLRVASLRAVPGGLEVRWPSVAGRVYAVEFARGLGGAWLPVSPDEPATPPENAFVLPGADGGFFRVVLKAEGE